MLDVQLLASLGLLTSLVKCMQPLSQYVLCPLCRILYDKRFNAFHYPVSDEDAPNYRSIIQNPMDVATILQHVDNGHYITSAAFLQDIDLIVSNAKACILCLQFFFFGWVGLGWVVCVCERVCNGECMLVIIALTKYNQC